MKIKGLFFLLLLASFTRAQVNQHHTISCPGFIIDTNLLNNSPRIATQVNTMPCCDYVNALVMPVVVHVILTGEPVDTSINIPNSDIISQLETTNQHFRKLIADPNLYPGIATDVHIEFQLARSNPQGNPTTGIERITVVSNSGYFSEAYLDTVIKPQTIWDPYRYLNIWITNLVDNHSPPRGIGGYGTFPVNSGLPGLENYTINSSSEGVVVNFISINRLHAASSLTHEIGHYLGLFHTFGSTNNPPPTIFCLGNEDYCDDTPETKGRFFNIDSLSHCGNDYYSCGGREMIENFMDYTIPCHQIFTNDQSSRMNQALTAFNRPTHFPSAYNEWYGLDIYEPNNSSGAPASVFPTINSTSLDSSINSYIFQNNDQDWYKINIQGTGVLTLSLANLPDNYDLELYGPGGLSEWLDGSYSSGTTTEQIVFTYNSQSPTYLFAKIYGFSDGSNHALNRCNPYQLRLQWLPTNTCATVYANISHTDLTAQGANNGTATVTVTSGTSPYTYLWSNGATTSSISGLTSGTYTVTITGNDGCALTLSVYVGIQGQQQPYCYGTTTLTASSANFSDGSGNSPYVNNSQCEWLIDPTINNATVTLTFTAFALASDDVVNIYDGSNTGAPLLGSFTVNSMPPQFVSSGTTLFVTFISNNVDSSSGWSAYYTSQILSSGPGIVMYEYWCDADYLNKIQIGISPQNQFHLNTDLSLPTNLNVGLHSFHVRFKDDAGQWSSVLSQFFYKTNNNPNGNNPNTISTCQFWFDNDFGNAVTQSTGNQNTYNLISDLATGSITTGLHSFHIRFKDAADQWSSVLSQFFYKIGNGINPNNKITAYRYWFDMNDANLITNNLGTPVDPLLLNTQIDASALPQGDHTFHIQFKDIAAQWSSVLTDTFTKAFLPNALFTANPTVLCQPGTVTFTNNSVDANSYSWTFGDGGTSTATSPTHNYTSPGTFTVTLVATDTQSGLSDTQTNSISVSAPINAIATPQGSTTFCQDGNVILNANSGNNYSYQWLLNGNNIANATNQSYTASVSGSYSVIITNDLNCIGTSAAVSVTVSPLVTPAVSISASNTVICSGASVTFTPAPVNGGNSPTYQWFVNGVSQGSSPTFTTSSLQDGDDVTCTLTSNASCLTAATATSNTITISVSSNPTATINPSGTVSVCQGSTVTLTASSGIAYSWSSGQTTQSITVGQGSYTVTVTNPGGCFGNATSAATTVQLNNAPAQPTITQNGNDLVSSASSGNQWYDVNGAIAGATNQTFTPIADGDYYVIVTDQNGCSSIASATYNYITTSVSNAEITEASFNVYPNPNDGNFNIVYRTTETENIYLTILNNIGQLVRTEQHLNVTGEYLINFNLQLAQGEYYIQLISPVKVYSSKLVVY